MSVDRPAWAPAYLDASEVALLLREPACDDCGHTRGLVRWLAYGTIRCGEHPITRLSLDELHECRVV